LLTVRHPRIPHFQWADLPVGSTNMIIASRRIAGIRPGMLAAIAAGASLLPAGQAGAQCPAHWSSQFAQEGLTQSVRALVVFDDDGPGPHPPTLIVGGDFKSANGVTLNYIARWNGTGWEPMAEGFSAPVECLYVFDPDGDGPIPPTLYAGGDFNVGN